MKHCLAEDSIVSSQLDVDEFIPFSFWDDEIFKRVKSIRCIMSSYDFIYSRLWAINGIGKWWTALNISATLRRIISGTVLMDSSLIIFQDEIQIHFNEHFETFCIFLRCFLSFRIVINKYSNLDLFCFLFWVMQINHFL